jgi:hypothetical protein
LKPHLITALVFLAACLLYWQGFTVSSLSLLIGGGLMEIWFWFRVFGLDKTGD